MDWRELSQDALDAAYNQAVYAPNMTEVITRLSTKSQSVRHTLGNPERHQYGDQAIESLDVFPCNTPVSPMVIFIHGGSWQSGQARDNAFPALTVVNAGASLIVPDFSPVDDFQGDLQGMLDQLQRAITWTVQHAEQLGGNPEKLVLCGFSSGAHLAGVLLTRDWSGLGLPRNPFHGALLCSGMYDMTPVSRSFRREFVTLNESNIPTLSPQLNLEEIQCPLVVAWGTEESPEFQRQGREFVQGLKRQGKPVTKLIAENLNHFEIIESLYSADSMLSIALSELVKGLPSQAVCP